MKELDRARWPAGAGRNSSGALVASIRGLSVSTIWRWLHDDAILRKLPWFHRRLDLSERSRCLQGSGGILDRCHERVGRGT